MPKVVHFEIPADDVTRAREFYGGVFGWQLREMQEMDYTLVETVPVDQGRRSSRSSRVRSTAD